MTGLLGTLTAGVPLLAVACGQESAPTQTKAPVTVRYMSNLPEILPEGAARLAGFDEFNKTNDQKITINVEEGKAVTDLAKFKSLASAGSTPDLYFSSYFDGGELFAIGYRNNINPVERTLLC